MHLRYRTDTSSCLTRVRGGQLTLPTAHSRINLLAFLQEPRPQLPEQLQQLVLPLLQELLPPLELPLLQQELLARLLLFQLQQHH